MRKVFVPHYVFPKDVPWNQLVAAKVAHPTVPMRVCVNPDSGPGTSADSSYVAGIKQLVSVGIDVAMYVATGYGARTDVTANIDRIVAFGYQAAGVKGVFFDEWPSSSGLEAKYHAYSDYAGAHGFAYTMGNPGTDLAESYMPCADVFCVYESAGLPPPLSGWHSNYDPDRFSLLAYGVGTNPDAWVRSAGATASWLYATNDTLPNPWDTVPPYFSAFLDSVAAANAVVVVPPPPPPPPVVVAPPPPPPPPPVVVTPPPPSTTTTTTLALRPGAKVTLVYSDGVLSTVSVTQ